MKAGIFMFIQRIMQSSLVFQHIIENMHDGVLTIDNSGIITTMNGAAESILEIKKEQLLNRKFSDVFFDYRENEDFIQIILDSIYDDSMSHHKICGYYTGTRLKSLFMTTSLLKAEIECDMKSLGVTVLFSDVTELQELRDAAAAFEKIKTLNQKLERLSYIDELTGLPNRRFFNDACSREWDRTAREQKNLAIIMIDIDYFKEINDHQGHRAGDACLTAAAGALKKALRRPYDLIARYGGDEFIAMIPDAGIAAAREIAETMRMNISGLDIENIPSPFKKLTASIGYSSLDTSGASEWEELIKSADEALYRAKQNGRNRISE